MGNTFNLRGARSSKFTGSSSSRTRKGNLFRKNITLDRSFHGLVIEIIIEKEESLKQFVVRALERHLEKVTAGSVKRSPEQEKEHKVGSSIIIPRDLVKDIKRASHTSGISENEVILQCLRAEIEALKESNPELFPSSGGRSPISTRKQ